MTAEQKERMKYEVEVQKARELKRIADALEIISGITTPRMIKGDLTPEDFESIRNVMGKRSLITSIDEAKE